MRTRMLPLLVFISLLLLISLACGLNLGERVESIQPAVATAEEAARTAAVSAQTAVAQAGDLAGTASAIATAQGPEAIATIKAMATPLASYLNEKLAEVEPDADGNYSVSLTEEEMNNILRVRQLLGGDLLGAAVQSQQATFSDGRIILSGTIMEPLPGQLLVKMRPSVVDGALQLDIEEATVAGNQAPQPAIDAAEAAISGPVSEALNALPVDLVLHDISAADGLLTITARPAPQ